MLKATMRHQQQQLLLLLQHPRVADALTFSVTFGGSTPQAKSAVVDASGHLRPAGTDRVSALAGQGKAIGIASVCPSSVCSH